MTVKSRSKKPTPILFLIQVWGDVEPLLSGPYKTDKSRDAKARSLRNDDEGTLIRLDIVDGRPEVYPFGAQELGEVE